MRKSSKGRRALLHTPSRGRPLASVRLVRPAGLEGLPCLRVGGRGADVPTPSPDVAVDHQHQEPVGRAGALLEARGSRAGLVRSRGAEGGRAHAAIGTIHLTADALRRALCDPEVVVVVALGHGFYPSKFKYVLPKPPRCRRLFSLKYLRWEENIL